MKKLICIALAMVLTAAAALAAPQLSNSLFASAKRAAEWLMSGDFYALASQTPFSGTAPSAGEWARFAANFKASGHAQQQYAVGYWSNGSWRVAVPLREPDSPDVEVLLLTSEDGYAFSGYRYASWGQVEREYAESDHVVWNGEYLPAAPKVFAD